MKSDEIKARAERYNRIEKEADSIGRLIGVRRLKPSEEMRITGLTADLDGFNQALGTECVVRSHFDSYKPGDVISDQSKIDAILAGPHKRDVGIEEKPIQVPKRAPYFVCAMVCEVDGIPFTMPKTRGELDAVYDRLDKEGIEAAMKAYIRLEGADKPEEQSAETVIDEAKN